MMSVPCWCGWNWQSVRQDAPVCNYTPRLSIAGIVSQLPQRWRIGEPVRK
jgi:hypothetical protein